jgi:N-acetylglucosaminyldiphosphoundecaprenol N-acetyl-beta-D-mannosaminyltransferase
MSTVERSVWTPAPALARIGRTNILGVGVSAINMQMALDTIDGWIAMRSRGHYVCVTGVHGIMECQRDPSLRRIHNRASLVTPDGMPLVWINKLRGKGFVSRVYGPDLMLAVCERGLAPGNDQPGYRHFLYGGKPGLADRLSQRLEQHLPGLQIVGTHTPPFRALTPEEDMHTVDAINSAKPDVVWVGLSTPKQERWLAEHASSVHAFVLIGVGAAFDFLAGTKPQAPRWIQRSGFEWLFRLLSEPRRLWRRYLVNNPQFVLLSLAQALGLKRWEIE